MADLLQPHRITRDLPRTPDGSVVDRSAREVHKSAEDRITIVLLGSYLVAAAYTHPLGSGSLTSRMCPGDLIALLLIVKAVARVFGGASLRIPLVGLAFIPFLVAFTISSIVGRDSVTSLPELVAHCFLAITYMVMFTEMLHLGEECVLGLLEFWIVATGALALFAIIEFFFFPGLIEHDTPGFAGTFRNTGQAGTYFGIVASAGVCFTIAGLPKRPILTYVALAMIYLALIFTVKRAALIGFVAGFVLILAATFVSGIKLSRRGLRAFTLAGVALMLMQFATSIFASTDTYLEYVYRHKITDYAEQDFGNDQFMAETIRVSLEAFARSPFFGVGEGGIEGWTSSFEVHSTYLKVLSSHGLFGMMSYLLFMGVLISGIWRGRKIPRVGAFFFVMFFMFLGLLISWGYTYHIRKREFWILVAFLTALSDLAFMPSDERQQAFKATFKSP